MPNPVTEAFGASTWLTVALGVVLFFWYTRDYWELVMRTLGRDLTGLSVLIRVKLLLRKYKKQDASVASLFRKNVKKHPLKPLFLYEDQVWTFQDIEDFSNRVGNYFLTLGFTAGDEVTLFMENRPEYVGIWLGLSKIGVIPALVNSGLRSSALAASVGVVEGTRALIYGTELDQAVKEALPLMEDKGLQLEYFAYGSEKSQITRAQDLGAVLKGISAREPEYEAGFLDKLLYIYTSGTTGLPKAAIIRQSRYIMLAQPNCMPGIVGQDHVIYVSMPLYHSLGGGVGVGLALIHGHTLVIKRKFSPRTFWDDCIKTKCTMFIYVGEVCRYLLAQPKMAKDRQHQVRTMLGVGFRSNIWSDFVQRFGVASVLEFYGSTEGNFQIVNLNSAAGSCGFIPQIIPEAIRNFLFPAVLVKVDQETGEPLRTRAGLCVRCKAGEIGQFVVKIVTGDPLRNFDGYVDRSATEKKILRSVQSKDDSCFMTGDLVMMDKYGYVYFRDRIGDTFRWKSENVSTTEVESILMKCLPLSDAVVYGVEIPACEGRAGMAAMLPSEGPEKLSVKSLYDRICTDLPSYAMPIFVRILDKVDLTGTFKFNKVALKRDSFDPQVTRDSIYYLDAKAKIYCHLTKDLYEDILNGQIRF